MTFMDWCKKWIWEFFIKKLCLTILKMVTILILIIITYMFSVDKNNTGAIIFAGFTLFFTLCFWSSNFEIVELLGAKFKIKELKNSINELKYLSKAISIISLEIIQSKNRMGPGDKRKEQEFFNEINAILDNVNTPEKEKNEIFDKYWHSWVIWDYFHKITKLIREEIRGKEVSWADFDKNFRKKIAYKCPENHTSSFLKEILKWAKENVNEYDWSNIEQHINEFEYYTQNKKFKDFSRWERLFKQMDE